MITPEQLAKAGKESSNQSALFCWAALNTQEYPQLKYLIHIPNGGYRDEREAASLKAQGVRPGVPDIMLPLPTIHYAGLWIEMKREKYRTQKDGGLNPDQIRWRDYLRSVGYAVYTAYNWIEARDLIVRYLKYGR